jgi:hypothetical protein
MPPLSIPVAKGAELLLLLLLMLMDTGEYGDRFFLLDGDSDKSIFIE